MENMLTDLPHMLLGAGILLLVAEILMGFTTILLLTLGLSLMATSGLMYMGVLSPDILDAFVSTAVIDVVLTAAMWAPMRRLQATKAPKNVTSDWIGDTFELESDVAPNAPGQSKFSGVVWKIKSTHTITAGTTVTIEKVEVGLLHVTPA